MLRVNLTSQTITPIPTSDYAPDFIGGRGIAAKVVWDEVPPETRAFDPGNRLIFALGPLAGIPAIAGSRWGIFGKSALNTPEKFCYGNLGGRLGAELKFAGFDGLIIEGRAERPVYLLVRNGTAELKDASPLWGKGAARTRDALKREWGDSMRVVAIGPAGENRVTTAGILADDDASGSGGLGAVMGSKRLKAIAIKGERSKIPVARPEELQQLTDYFRKVRGEAFIAWGMDFMASGPGTKKAPCYGCAGNCIRVTYTDAAGHRGKYMCQSGMFYLQWSWKYYGKQNDVPFQANRLCDDYGLDTWSLELMLGWLSRCFKAGILTEEQTGLPFSKMGSIEFIEALVRMIAFRQGFGDVLAQGLERAAGQIGGEAPSLIRRPDPYEPRLYITTALLWAFEPREPIQALHEIGMPLAQWVSWVKKSKDAYVTSEVIRSIAKRFWGSEAAGDFSSYEGKALAARMIQDRQYAKECLILCDWVYPILASKATPDHVGDPTIESKLYSAVAGNDLDEEGLYRIGERVFNLQRALLLRDGHRPRLDDRLPEEWHTMPLKRGVMDPDCLVPGKGGKITSRIGSVIARKDFEAMKDEFYRLRGWDPNSGLQTRETLERLGLKMVADDLARRGLLAGDESR